MKNVAAAPSIGGSNIPEIVFCLYQLMFCACTVQLVIGGSFERGRIVPSLIFAFFWATVVYCPIACWTWNPNGWLFKLPSLDFAGGGPVHISSGWSALAYAFALGKRKHTGERSHGRPHNTTLIFLGTVLIWFGWFGFNVSFLPLHCSSEGGASTHKLLLTYNRVDLQSTAQSEP
jgi:Amt family ammonium transporter